MTVLSILVGVVSDELPKLARIANLLDARVLLISRYDSIWDLDDVLAAADRFGDHLVGVLFNAVTDTNLETARTDVTSFLQSRGISVGVIPRTTELAGVTVADLVRELDAEVLTETPTDGIVDRFLVGAMSSDSALQYFRRVNNAALITGGDRSDIQTVALETPGINCLVLTGGFRPSNMLLSKAEDNDVPVLLLHDDTGTTIDMVEDMLRSGRTRDERTVTRMQELMEKHVDIETLLSGSTGETDADNPSNDDSRSE